MKQPCLLTLLFCLTASASAQFNPYQDALFLANVTGSSAQLPIDANTLPTLNRYFGTGDAGSVQKQMETNRFFQGWTTIPQITTQSFPGNHPVNLSNPGALNISNFAEGIARFLAERAQDELSAAFFDQMKTQLDNYPELRTLFPSTYQVMLQIKTYAYANVLQVLKEAFETDMQNLSTDLNNLTTLTTADCTGTGEGKDSCISRMTKLQAFFAPSSVQGEWVKVGLAALRDIKTGYSPPDMLDNVVADPAFQVLKNLSPTDRASVNIANCIQLVDLVSNSFRSPIAGELWLSPSDISKLTSNPVAMRIYLGLVTQLSSDIKFCDAGGKLLQFKDLFQLSNPPTSGEIQMAINNFGLVAQQLGADFAIASGAFKKIKTANSSGSKPDPAALYDCYRTTANLVQELLNQGFVTGKIPDIKSTGNAVLNILNPTVNLSYHIYAKNYTSAVWDIIALAGNIEIANHTGVFNQQQSLLDAGALKALTKYGTLISTVASAQNSTEVKNAIKSAALPVGSAAIKKNSAWSISVNAYVGGYFGAAYYQQPSPINSSKTNLSGAMSTYGLYAPIGIAFNRGFETKHNNNPSVSIFAQLIDVGALVNFYLIHGDTSTLPSNVKIHLLDIFAPGVQVALGFPKIPVSFTSGVQFIPALSQLDQLNTQTEQTVSPGIRIHASLVVDIPMFNVKVWDFKKDKKLN